MKAYQEIGRKLQNAREEAGLSQQELAKMLECTQSALSNYELGKRRVYLAEIERIGKVLGKPVNYFLEGVSDDQSNQDDLKMILETPYIKKIIYALKDMKLSQMKSVLDYINWKKNEG